PDQGSWHTSAAALPHARFNALTFQRFNVSFVRSLLQSASSHDAQIIPVPGCRNTFSRGEGPRLICARGDSLLTQLADVPILSIRRVPEFDCIVRIELLAPGSIRMKKPVAHNERPLRRLWPKLMYHDVFRVQAQQHVRKNRVIQYALQ